MKKLPEHVPDGQVRPILISTGNAEPMTGRPWRWWKDHAHELGLEIRHIGTKPFIVAEEALAAIKRHGELIAEAKPANDDAESEAEPTIADLRARLGLRRAIGVGK